MTQAHYQQLYQPLQFFADLPAWIAAHTARDGALSFDVLPLDLSFNALPTFAVRVLDDGREIGVYKCNLSQFTDEAGRDCVLFSPLVVTWRDGQVPQGDISRRIVAHCVRSARGFCSSKQDAPVMGVLVTSGNLTKERAGLPFFTALGWEIVTEETAQRPIYQLIIKSLEKAAATFLEEGGKPISFAVTEIPSAVDKCHKMAD
ncbi:MAG: hypothetical protein EP349_00720 [Alphaproteobacteria bacterium]|nr:MAG: hypothetical protein EP349_00720 [Alphaproteobacteria bacterium]